MSQLCEWWLSGRGALCERQAAVVIGAQCPECGRSENMATCLTCHTNVAEWGECKDCRVPARVSEPVPIEKVRAA